MTRVLYRGKRYYVRTEVRPHMTHIHIYETRRGQSAGYVPVGDVVPVKLALVTQKPRQLDMFKGS